MLDLMRKHAKSWVINVMIAAIAIVFIFWGAGTYRQKELANVATVNGEPISMIEYQDTYRRLLNTVQNRYGDQLNEELLDSLNLKKEALEALINESLILQQARDLGVEVIDQEVQVAISENPMFQVDGRFDKSRYLNMLSRFPYTPSEYEALVRQERLSRKMRDLIQGLAKVTPVEARDFFHLINDQINLEFVLFTPDKYKDQVAITPEEIKTFYEAKKERYRLPAKVKVAYMTFLSKDYEKSVEVGDEEILDYYETHLDEYREPEKVMARHILFKLDQDAPEEKVAEVKARAEEVLKEIKAGTDDDFRKLAIKYSEGPTAPTGGSLGWFSREQMVKPFSDAAFSLEKGQVSDPVRTRFGWHIIKVEDKRPASEKTVDQVRDQIRQKKVQEKAVVQAERQAIEAADEVALTQNFEETATKLNRTVTTTDFFSADQPLPEVKSDPKFNQLAMTLKKGEVGPILDIDNGFYLIKAVDKKDSYLPELSEVEKKVESDLIEEKALALAEKAAAAFLEKSLADGKWDLPDTKQVAKAETELKTETIKEQALPADASTGKTDAAASDQNQTTASGEPSTENQGTPVTVATDTSSSDAADQSPVPATTADSGTGQQDAGSPAPQPVADSDKPDAPATTATPADGKPPVQDQTVAAAAQVPDTKVEETGPFTRNQPVPQIGDNYELKSEAFSLNLSGAFGTRAYKGDQGYYVIRLKEKLPAAPEQFEKDKERLMTGLAQAKGQTYLQQWLEAIKAGSEIKIEPGVI